MSRPPSRSDTSSAPPSVSSCFSSLTPLYLDEENSPTTLNGGCKHKDHRVQEDGRACDSDLCNDPMETKWLSSYLRTGKTEFDDVGDGGMKTVKDDGVHVVIATGIGVHVLLH